MQGAHGCARAASTAKRGRVRGGGVYGPSLLRMQMIHLALCGSLSSNAPPTFASTAHWDPAHTSSQMRVRSSARRKSCGCRSPIRDDRSRRRSRGRDLHGRRSHPRPTSERHCAQATGLHFGRELRQVHRGSSRSRRCRNTSSIEDDVLPSIASVA